MNYFDFVPLNYCHSYRLGSSPKIIRQKDQCAAAKIVSAESLTEYF